MARQAQIVKRDKEKYQTKEKTTIIAYAQSIYNTLKK
jgi:hypothetical protein